MVPQGGPGILFGHASCICQGIIRAMFLLVSVNVRRSGYLCIVRCIVDCDLRECLRGRLYLYAAMSFARHDWQTRISGISLVPERSISDPSFDRLARQQPSLPDK